MRGSVTGAVHDSSPDHSRPGEGIEPDDARQPSNALSVETMPSSRRVDRIARRQPPVPPHDVGGLFDLASGHRERVAEPTSPTPRVDVEHLLERLDVTP